MAKRVKNGVVGWNGRTGMVRGRNVNSRLRIPRLTSSSAVGRSAMSLSSLSCKQDQRIHNYDDTTA